MIPSISRFRCVEINGDFVGASLRPRFLFDTVLPMAKIYAVR